MFSRGNKGKDKLNEPVAPSQDEKQAEAVTRETMSREELFSHDESAKKIYEDIICLLYTSPSPRDTR